MLEAKKDDIFKLEPNFSDPFRQTLFSVVKKPLSKILCLSRLNAIYGSVYQEWSKDVATPESESEFARRVVDHMGISFDTTAEDMARIPTDGPAVVVANHPFGAIEGLILALLLKAVRPDVKIMANYILGMIPELRNMFFCVDPFGRTDSHSKNIGPLKDSIRWVKKGGMLGVFPAGEVSSVKITKRMVADPAWSPTVGRILKISKAQAIPIFFDGRNGALFQLLGLIHPRFRTVMLPRENLSKSSKPVKVCVGAPIPHEKLAQFKTDEDMISYLRFRTYLLRQRATTPKKIMTFKARQKPVATVKNRKFLKDFANSLPEDKVLVKSGNFRVFEAGAGDVPGLLYELGRIREITFRQVGEGTGKSLDTDAFDEYYRHLLLWDNANERIAGSYRLGRTDEIIHQKGVKGLYSSTLFNFQPQFFDEVKPALELGRSFVRREYQRSYSALLMLWKGLANLVSKEARYRYLFGPVSISAEYHPVSRDLLIEFMRRHHGMGSMSRYVRPKNPPKLASIKRLDAQVPEAAYTLAEDAGICISEIEPGKVMPILLKQYLKLNGKIVDFNMDPDFGNCVDGLIIVDLLDTHEKILKKFMGREATDSYLENIKKVVSEAE